MRTPHRQGDRQGRTWQRMYVCRLCWSAVTAIGFVSLSPLVLGGSAFAQESPGSSEEDVRLVYAEAEGATLDEATQGALRTAVEQGVGVFVTSRVRVENDELIEDKILALSNGYIHSYRVVETKERGGQVLVRVVAEVGMRQIRESLEAAGVEVALSGDLFFRRAALQAEQREDEIEVLRSLFYDDVEKPNVYDYSVKIDHSPLLKVVDCDAWVARERKVDCKEEFYEVGVTVTRTPNANYIREIENLRDLLIAIVGPAHHTENWNGVYREGVPLAPAHSRFLAENQYGDLNVLQNSLVPIDVYIAGAVGLDFFLNSKMVEQNLSGPYDKAFFPDATFVGGYVVVVPDPNSATYHGFLLRSHASAFILANYINQVFYAHNLALELEGTRALRLTSDPMLDLCRPEQDVQDELLPTLLGANLRRRNATVSDGLVGGPPIQVRYTKDWVRFFTHAANEKYALLIVDVPGNSLGSFREWEYERAKLEDWYFNIPFLLRASVLEGIEAVSVEPLDLQMRDGLMVSTMSRGEEMRIVLGSSQCYEI